MRPRSVPAGLPALILIVSLAMVGLVGVPAASAKNYRCMTINDRINTTYFWDVQAAIDDAEPGDTLWIRGYCFDTTLSIDKSLTLTGQRIPGFEPPRIDANGQGSVVHISGADVQVEISSLSLTGGGKYFQPAYYGGGIRNDGSTLTLNDVTITHNIAYWGGGVFNAGGDVVINDSTIEQNLVRPVGEGGGGIYTVGGTLTLRASRVADNQAYGTGGGIYAGTRNPITGTSDFTGTVVLSDTTVEGNTVAGGDVGGGGIALRSSQGTLTLTDTTVQDNESYHKGGGIYTAGPTTMTRTTIRNNTATADVGGGVANGGRPLTLTDTTVQGNHALDGGGIDVGGPVTLAGTSTLVSNHATRHGGGAYVHNSMSDHLTLTGPNASIHHNSAGTAGGGIYAPSATKLTNCTDGGNVYSNTPQDIFLIAP